MPVEEELLGGRVLVIEDDTEITDALRRSLRHEGYEVRTAGDGVEALDTAAEFIPDLVVLDLGLPRLDGIEVCRQLRADGDVPILILTARTETDDRVTGLDSGADDYLVKPFSFDELLARVRALARRQVGPRPTVLSAGDLRLDTTTHQLRRGSEEIPLSNREVAILEAFMRRPGQILSRFDLLELVWEGDFDHRSNVVDVAVRRLREKIDRPFGVESIETVRGAGYRLCDSVES